MAFWGTNRPSVQPWPLPGQRYTDFPPPAVVGNTRRRSSVAGFLMLLFLGVAGSVGKLYLSSGNQTPAQDAAQNERIPWASRTQLAPPTDMYRDSPTQTRTLAARQLPLNETQPLRSVRLELVPAPQSSPQPFQGGGRLEAFPTSRPKLESLDEPLPENEAPGASEPDPTPRQTIPEHRLVPIDQEPKPAQPPQSQYVRPGGPSSANGWRLRQFKKPRARKVRPRVDPRYACLFGPEDGEPSSQKCSSGD